MANYGQAEVKARADPQAITPYDPIPQNHLDYLTLVQVVTNTLLRLYFSIRLNNTESLLDSDTYQVDGEGTSVTVTSVTRYRHKKLDLHISGLLTETPYSLSILQDIFDVNGNKVKIENPYVFNTVVVAILAAAASSYNTVDVTFNAPMIDNADLTDPTNYVIAYAPATAPLRYTIGSVAGTEIDITFNRDMSLNADLCTPANYAIVLVPGVEPLAYTVASLTTTTVVVSFNKEMRINTDLIDPTKYSISSGTVAVPLSYTVVAVDSRHVEVTFNKDVAINADLVDPTSYVIA